MELSEEQAKEYFAKLNPPKRELSDDELDNVSGGMRGAGTCIPCPKCETQGRYTGSGNEWKCPTCGCRWDFLTREILN